MDEFYYNASLFMVNADGTGLTRLTEVPGGDFDPAWSPDGVHIAFTSFRDGHLDIYIYNMVDQSAMRITNTGSDVEPRSPAWSPDGKFIAYAVKRFGVYQIWLMTETGEDQRQVVRSGTDYSDYLPTWTPDGLYIVFNQRQSGAASLPYLMSIVPQNTTIQQGTPLSFKPLPIENVDYSPDGLWVVYEGQAKDQNTDIFYADVNGKNQVRLTIGPGLDFDPEWRPVVLQ
jgi:Tol biopolymer transport system component